MGFLLSKLLPLALDPLGRTLLPQLAGLLGRRRHWGAKLSDIGVALLRLASMPLVSRALIWNLEEPASRQGHSPYRALTRCWCWGGRLRPALVRELKEIWEV